MRPLRHPVLTAGAFGIAALVMSVLAVFVPLLAAVVAIVLVAVFIRFVYRFAVRFAVRRSKPTW